MKKRIAINGFGRIGRLTLRNLLKNNDIEIIAINDLADNETLAHLFKYDSSQGIFEGIVSSTHDTITIDNNTIQAYAERNPENLPWSELNIDVVLECTGVFRTKDKAKLHIDAGAKKIILSAPAKSEGFKTIVLGVNNELIDKDSIFYSNASCTTNCLAPVIKILHDNFGFVQGSMTTTHAYTGAQRIQDGPAKDLRRARAAAINIVPTTTGSAKAVGQVIPEIKDKLFAMAVRVPVVTGSMIEVNAILEKSTTVEELNETFKRYTQNEMEGIVEYCENPIVSTDIIGSHYSSIYDSLLTKVMGNFVKVVAWYDNEAGYSTRLSDLTNLV